MSLFYQKGSSNLSASLFLCLVYLSFSFLEAAGEKQISAVSGGDSYAFGQVAAPLQGLPGINKTNMHACTPSCRDSRTSNQAINIHWTMERNRNIWKESIEAQRSSRPAEKSQDLNHDQIALRQKRKYKMVFCSHWCVNVLPLGGKVWSVRHCCHFLFFCFHGVGHFIECTQMFLA